MTDAETMKTDREMLKLLRDPFPAHQISKLPKPYKDSTTNGRCAECGGWHKLPAAHLDYVGHAALTDRLLDVDPRWNWEPLSLDDNGLPRFDPSGGLWIKLTICGITRLGYGHAVQRTFKDPGAREKEVIKDPGAREKEVIGDALRNAAMRFGAALDLWHKGQLHVDEGGNGDQTSGSLKDMLEKDKYAAKHLHEMTGVSDIMRGDTDGEKVVKSPQIVAYLNHVKDVSSLQDYWKRLTKEQREAHETEKNEAKERLSQAHRWPQVEDA